MPPEQIQFTSETDTYGRAPSARPASAITGLVIRWGLAKDEQGATYVLLGTTVAAVVLAIVIPMVIGAPSAQRIPQAEVDASLNAHIPHPTTNPYGP